MFKTLIRNNIKFRSLIHGSSSFKRNFVSFNNFNSENNELKSILLFDM